MSADDDGGDEFSLSPSLLPEDGDESCLISEGGGRLGSGGGVAASFGGDGVVFSFG
jgi:hypothetical protein